MPIVRVSSKYQITIPKPIRDKLEIVPGQGLIIAEKDGAILLTPTPLNPAEFLCGIFKGEPSMAEELLSDRRRDIEHE